MYLGGPLPGERGGNVPYWKECPRCGSHLDPGEACDCGDQEKEKATKRPGASEAKGIRLTYKKPTTLEVKGRPKYPCPFR